LMNLLLWQITYRRSHFYTVFFILSTTSYKQIIATIIVKYCPSTKYGSQK